MIGFRREGEDDLPMNRKGVAAMVKEAIAGLINTDLPNAVKTHTAPIMTGLDEVRAAIRGRVQDPPVVPPVVPPVALPPEISGRLAELERTNAGLAKDLKTITEGKKSADEKAEKAERQNAIKDALNGYQFVNDTARASAYRLIELEIKRADDGQLIGGENLPLGNYVTEMMKTNDYLLAPEDTGGSGASRQQIRQQSGVGIETIKKGMTGDERAAVVAQISNAVAQVQ